MNHLTLLPSWETVTRPAVRHFGSKWQISQTIASHFPAHGTYTEAYCGSASVFLRKPPAPVEVLNDMNPGTINFLRVVQSRPEELIEALNNTPRNRDEFYGCFKPHPDPLEWARRYACLGWGGYVGAGGRWSGGCSDARLQRLQKMKFDFLRVISSRLRDTIIQQRDALDTLREYDSPTTLHYVDPPYPKEARSSRDNRCKNSAPRRQYACEMLEEEAHQVLANKLKGLAGYVVLSGRVCPLYDRLFGDWRRVDIPARDTDRKSAVESIWLNF